MPNNVYWLDKNGITQGCNSNVLDFIGLKTLDEFVGITYKQMGEIAGWTLGHAQVYEHDDREVMDTKKPKLNNEDPPILNNDGTLTYYSSSRVPLFDQEHNEVIGVVGISVDITEQKQLLNDLKQAKERAESANEAKTEFLANMRHDIRTPLSGIVGFSEILKSEVNEPRLKEYADNLIASSHALLTLLDEVLDAIKVSSGEIPVQKKKFNLANTLEHMTQLFAAKAAEKKLDLRLCISPELPHFLIGDRVRLHRIALELVGNALNFTERGHVSVQVDMAKKEQQKLIIRMTVTDTGMGIPKDKQDDIYIQFKRLTPSYQGIYKGSGLGLYVVKQFIDELNGEIYVDSEPFKGTTFTCLIPLQIPFLDDESGTNPLLDAIETHSAFFLSQNASSIATTNTTDNGQRFSPILLVEDNYIAQKVAQTILSTMHCQVDIANNGTEALMHCRQKKYDLIFMDIGLGDGMDGYEVTRHIRSKEQDTTHTPIIALTAHGADESKQRCIESGMDAVLTKPLTQAHTIDILKTFIPTRQESDSNISQNTPSDLPDLDEQLFQLNQFSLLNEDEALNNCGSLPTVHELLRMMAETLPSDLDLMKNAFVTKDYSMIEKTAHKIKGGAVYIGTSRMRYACQYLERYWKSGQRELMDALYHQAISTINETLIYIKGWLAKY